MYDFSFRQRPHTDRKDGSKARMGSKQLVPAMDEPPTFSFCWDNVQMMAHRKHQVYGFHQL